MFAVEDVRVCFGVSWQYQDLIVVFGGADGEGEGNGGCCEQHER